LEEQQLLCLSRSEIEAALAAGEFKVLGWTTAVALALLNMARRVGVCRSDGGLNG